MSKSVRYLALTDISGPGFGSVTQGEYIHPAKAALLTENQIAWLLRAGGIREEYAPDVTANAANATSDTSDEDDRNMDEAAAEDAAEEADEEGVPVDEPMEVDLLDDVEDADDEPAAEPVKPAAKPARKGGKAK